MSTPTVSTIWESEWQQAWKTTLAMLRNRGYDAADLRATPAQEVMDTLQQTQEFTAICKRGACPADIFLYITMDPKVGIKAVRKLQGWLEEHAILDAIVIYKTSITPFAKQAILQRERDDGIAIQCFRTQELQLDLTQHQCVPRHEVLTESDKQRILAKYTTDVTKYPKLLKGDPVARYYGLKPGNMVQVTRQYECGTYLTYRMVV